MEQIWGRREPFLEKRFGVDKQDTGDMGHGTGGSGPIISVASIVATHAKTWT
jgi:hypothetical protein